MMISRDNLEKGTGGILGRILAVVLALLIVAVPVALLALLCRLIWWAVLG